MLGGRSLGLELEHEFLDLISISWSWSRSQCGGLGLDFKLQGKVLFFVSILEGKSLTWS